MKNEKKATKTIEPTKITEPKKTTKVRKPKPVEKVEVTNDILVAVAEKAIESDYSIIEFENHKRKYRIKVRYTDK